MREELEDFAMRMEHVLQNNDAKKAWSACTQNYLEHMLRKKQAKLQDAVCANDHGMVIKHSVDLANYCMMLSDNAVKLMGWRKS